MDSFRIAFAGDRDIAVDVLGFLLAQGAQPRALLVPDAGRASHDQELLGLCPFLGSERILRGTRFRRPGGIALLHRLGLDLIVAVHFPYVIPENVLSIPRIGVLNLHPAYLPYNRGWHTPTWALLEGTPIGATLHFMDAGVDTGDIVHQKALQVSGGDTAHSLYQRLKQLELEVFRSSWPQVAAGVFQKTPQDPAAGSVHARAELFSTPIQRIDLDEQVRAGDLVLRLRALTTNRLDEAAYYEMDGKRYRIQVVIHEEQCQD